MSSGRSQAGLRQLRIHGNPLPAAGPRQSPQAHPTLTYGYMGIELKSEEQLKYLIVRCVSILTSL